MRSSRIAFAHNLRGIAALLIVFSHVIIFFWYHQNIVTTVTGLPPYVGNLPLITKLLYPCEYFFALTGVAIFFLISGFVIPFALDKQEIGDFLIGRFFRIWPALLAGTIITLLGYFIANIYFDNSYYPPLKNIITSLLLISDFYKLQPLDAVIWTLEIEIKFYLLMAMLYHNLKNNPLSLVGYAGIFTVLLLHFNVKLDNSMAYFTFMFIGVTTNFYYKKQLTLNRFIFTVIALFCLFIIQFRENKILCEYYFFALLIFMLSFISNNKIKFSSILDKLANISYSLYITHGMFGHFFIRIFLTKFNTPDIAIIACISFDILMANIVHNYIEKPGILLGKRLNNYVNKLRAVSNESRKTENVAVGFDAT